MSHYSVTKCICHDRSFKELKQYAMQHRICTVKELQDCNMCSRGCRMCIPYIKRMLKTGETKFKPGAL